MSLSRRQVLRVATGLVASPAMGACGADGSGAADKTGETVLWYWPGGLSDTVLADAVRHFAPRTALKPTLIEGDFRARLTEALAGPAEGVPSIAGIKGEEIASFLPRADLFTDLHRVGADEVAGLYLPWKWQQASAPDNRLIGFPIDIGPTAMFYRADVFERAGLPVEPGEVTAQLGSWNDYFEAGIAIARALPGVKLLRNAPELFTIVICQGTKRFIDESNHFVGDGAHVRAAWDTAARLVGTGVSAGIPVEDDAAWKAGLRNGTLATELGAAWLGYDIKTAAPDAAGDWRVASGPAAGANYGGSFLSLPVNGRDPALAYEIVAWLLSPANQARAFTDAALFPAAPATYTMPALREPDAYFGGQVTVEVFGDSAQRAHRVYEAPADADVQRVYIRQLGAFERGDKTETEAWRDAVAEGRRLAASLGVN
ncbi:MULTISPECIES: ABC transporter substrate-binding protein [Catenuloplanes]|uniref:Cellobiose transport system substrate-binding protein n=1 Tax=Catenuloplanes niger TaxID=587534 RepID=A0AAE3ZLT9_9ACTN|nr:ABC transporter substrate-binding protein [Catenuloplanes niger]MDR7320235.1 cellobiose transport system substrate-binding protein [Catenuloplanes niger]